jgi:hypothetical protein
MGDAVGIGANRPFSEHCSWVVVDSPLGHAPTGRVVCDWPRWNRATRIEERDGLSYQTVTGNPSMAQHGWRAHDATAWQQELDSIRAALRTQGGVQCPSHATVFAGSAADDSTLRGPEVWRFPDFDLKLMGGDFGFSPPDSDPARPWRRGFLLLAIDHQSGRCY